MRPRTKGWCEIRCWLGLLLGTVAVAGLASAKPRSTAIFSGKDVPAECQEDYGNGTERFQTALKDGILAKGREDVAAFFTEGLEEIPEGSDCRFHYSQGIFDARGVLQQNIMLELFLDLRQADRQNLSAAKVDGLLDFYRDRFEHAGMNEKRVEKLAEDEETRNESLSRFQERMNQVVADENRAIPFGRYVFVEQNPFRPYTLYDYKWGNDGQILENEEGDVARAIGTYQEKMKQVWTKATKVTKEYLEWRPHLVFGKESLLYSYIERWTSNGKTTREEIEDAFMRAISDLTDSAKVLHMDVAPFFKLHRHMLRKQQQYLERDLQFMKKVKIALMSAPLLPVGFHLVGAAAAYTGVAYLTNIAVGLSVGAVATYAGIGAYNAYKEYTRRKKNDLPYHFTFALDQVVAAAVQSVPLATAMPFLVAGTAAGGKFAMVQMSRMISSGFNLARTAKALGWKGSLKALSKVPGKMIKTWGTAWWNEPWLALRYVSATGTTIGFEVAYRQLTLEGKKKFWYYDDEGNMHFNKQALVTIGGSIAFGAVGTPFLAGKSLPFWGRSLTATGLTVMSSAISQMISNQVIDPDRMNYDMAYGSLAGRPIGEAVRRLSYLDFIQDLGSGQKFGLFFLLDAALKAVISPVRAELVDRYVSDDKSAMKDLRGIFHDTFGIDLSGYTDEELLAACRDVLEEGDYARSNDKDIREKTPEESDEFHSSNRSNSVLREVAPESDEAA